jgi:hypothetical protein
MRVDPTGLWSPEAHDSLFDSALCPYIENGTITPEELCLVQSERRRFDKDTQSPDESFKHFMAKNGQSPQQAIEKANEFIERETDAAKQAWAEGDRTQALIHIARAGHTIQDSLSPSHADLSGPKVWNPWKEAQKFAMGHPDHSISDDLGVERSFDITHEIRNKADQRLRKLAEEVFGQ